MTKVGSVLPKDMKDPSLYELEEIQDTENSEKFNIYLLYIWDDFWFLVPLFDEQSRNFEIDNCNGFGKVCMVYKASKPGLFQLNLFDICFFMTPYLTSGTPSENPEFWFLDRSLNWTYLTQSFTNYYRLLISHLGLPQWPMLFTTDGLPPYLCVIHRQISQIRGK
jgi:hypothetical protein